MMHQEENESEKKSRYLLGIDAKLFIRFSVWYFSQNQSVFHRAISEFFLDSSCKKKDQEPHSLSKNDNKPTFFPEIHGDSPQKRHKRPR